jgi:hypothetical protein
VTKANVEDTKAHGYRSTSFGREELLLLAEAFMRVPGRAKHSTDKKVNKFWEELLLQLEELAATRKN